jgi:hypothetical protein
VVPDPVGEGPAGQVRHDQDHLPALVDHVEEAHHVGVLEAGEHLGLPADPAPGPVHVGRRSVQGQALAGDVAAVVVTGQVHHAHAAASEAGDRLVAHRTRLGRPCRTRAREPRSAGRVVNVT